MVVAVKKQVKKLCIASAIENVNIGCYNGFSNVFFDESYSHLSKVANFFSSTIPFKVMQFCHFLLQQKTAVVKLFVFQAK